MAPAVSASQGDLQHLLDDYLIEPSDTAPQDSTAACWAKEVHELSYDVDDFADELTTKLHCGGEGSSSNTASKKTNMIARLRGELHRWRWIADEITLFRARVKEAIRRHESYNLARCTSSPREEDDESGDERRRFLSLTLGMDVHGQLVGRDSRVGSLVRWLADGERKCKVGSILGLGGVGKTTVATEIYRLHGRQLESPFECRAFVRTSRKPDMTKILTDMLSQLRPQHQHQSQDVWEVDRLIETIRAHLQDKKEDYIIRKDNLVKQWMAEGFINPIENKDMEEVAGNYFDELVISQLNFLNRYKDYEKFREKASCPAFKKATEGLRQLQTLEVDARATAVPLDIVRAQCLLHLPLILLELLPNCHRYIFTSIPRWTGKLDRLRILNIAAMQISQDDHDSLKGLGSLTSLSLLVQTAPAQRIIVANAGFLALKYFMFVCTAPCMIFAEGAMPSVQRLNLRLNANEFKQYGTLEPGFEHLVALEEISVRIGGADADESDKEEVESALRTAIRKHPSTLMVDIQWVDWIFGVEGRDLDEDS
ncbi:hypothetical protein E2562_032483, partial [Oryza meyeriana var. granulata]